jgi:hypothetical protein
MERKNPFEQEGNELPEELRQDKKAQEAEKDEETRAAVVRTVIILSMVIVILFGMILTIRFVPRTITSFSSFSTSFVNFFKGKEKITLTTNDQNVVSGSTFTLTVKHSAKDTSKEGSYTLTYPCINGLHLEQTALASGNVYIHCDTPFTLTDISPLQIVPISVASNVVDVPITVSYTEEGSTTPKVSANTTITVVNDQIGNNPSQPILTPTTTPVTVIPTPTTTPVKPTPKPPVTNPKPVTPKPTLPDLSIRIIATGIIDPVTGQFVQTTNITPYDRAAVKFDVKNIGGVPSGTWRFNATLPSSATPFYQSAVQNSIGPESGVVFTIGFTPNQNGNNQVTITLDPGNTVRELNKNNNFASVNIYTRGY